MLDGYWPEPPLEDRKNLVIVHHGAKQGMRASINHAAAIARGRYLMKCDAHCAFDEGFDEKLRAVCEDRMVVIPRRYSLDAENWCIKKEKPAIDAHYLCYPYLKPEELGLHGNIWLERGKERRDVLVDDEMSSQGSCWFMRSRHFRRLGGLSENGYGTFVQEFQEIGLKTWLDDGRVVVNKKTWYAHLHKGRKYGRGYFIDKREMIDGTHYSMHYWMNDQWEKRKHDILWLVKKFWPVPGWPTKEDGSLDEEQVARDIEKWNNA